MLYMCFFLAGILLGAIVHEIDLGRNFKKYGDAKGWFVDIHKENK